MKDWKSTHKRFENWLQQLSTNHPLECSKQSAEKSHSGSAELLTLITQPNQSKAMGFSHRTTHRVNSTKHDEKWHEAIDKRSIVLQWLQKGLWCSTTPNTAKIYKLVVFLKACIILSIPTYLEENNIQLSTQTNLESSQSTRAYHKAPYLVLN